MISILDKVYARIAFDTKFNDTIEVRGSRVKEHLYQKLPTEYFERLSFHEDTIDKLLEEVQADEIHIDLYTLSKFTYGFYRKYSKYIVEDFYEKQ